MRLELEVPSTTVASEIENRGTLPGARQTWSPAALADTSPAPTVAGSPPATGTAVVVSAAFTWSGARVGLHARRRAATAAACGAAAEVPPNTKGGSYGGVRS